MLFLNEDELNYKSKSLILTFRSVIAIYQRLHSVYSHKVECLVCAGYVAVSHLTSINPELWHSYCIEQDQHNSSMYNLHRFYVYIVKIV